MYTVGVWSSLIALPRSRSALTSRGEFSAGIDDEGQIDFVRGGEFLGEGAQVLRIDFQLVLENVVAEFVAQCLGVRVEVARHHGRLIRPVVHGQREIVTHDRNLVGLRRLLDQRRGAPAHGTLQVLEDHDGDLRSLGRTQHGVQRVLRRGANDGAGKRDQRDDDRTTRRFQNVFFISVWVSCLSICAKPSLHH